MLLGLTLEVNDLSLITWYFNASYAVHEDWKEHSGEMITMGWRAIIIFSRKQKIITKSSTKAELVGIDDALPQILWTLYFIKAQGYTTMRNELKQDNMSAIKMEKNGGMKYIRVQYFLSKIKLTVGKYT